MIGGFFYVWIFLFFKIFVVGSGFLEFHGYLRDDNIDSGTILGYLRAAFAFIDAEGEVINDPEECAALRKYPEFRVSADESIDEVDE